MNQDLGLRILSQIMDWPDERARKEFSWLRFMARLKYDGYRDFLAGVRFIESLATWLQQFAPAEREAAYSFIRNDLVYIGPAEMQRLVELFYPRAVQHRLLRTVSARLGISKYRIWANPVAAAEFDRLKRKTLFMALSEGARIDILRHSNVGMLTNEQFVVATQVDPDKWQDLLKNLRDDLNEADAKFAIVYLIDDFMGTGTSFLRYDEDKKAWKGKVMRFRDSVAHATEILGGVTPFQDDWELCVHHYAASHAAAAAIQEREAKAHASLGAAGWFPAVHFSFGTVLPEGLPIDAEPARHRAMIELTQKYYDPIIRTRHTDIGGVTHLGLGYGGCALPLVLEHNTPNNAVALLWAETDGGRREGDVVAPAMRPLFRRRQRHS
ncbi:MAG: hypothetical protein L0210_06600 [Rhodospirillales bacterium]|nr:hypothetical protein [Rhodospirillales bacterium]